MNRLIGSYLLVISIFVVSVSANAAECDDPKTSEEIAQCIGKELRDADAKINLSYKELMSKLNKSGKVALKANQRTWIKDRNTTCKLDTNESDRERWYQILLQDYPKTVCVTRYTRKRTNEIESMLAILSSSQGGNDADTKSSPSLPTPPTQHYSSDLSFDGKPKVKHASGKWYFEFIVNYDEAVKIGPCVLTIGVVTDNDNGAFHGVLDNIRKKDAVKGILRYGFAVDLDNGKLYISRNGEWIGGAPGSNLGPDLKLGRDYRAVFQISADSYIPYFENKAIVRNLGDNPMTYALPAGYVPWRNEAQK